MSTEILTNTVTTDTADRVPGPAFPADDRAGEGYDRMDTLKAASGRRAATA